MIITKLSLDRRTFLRGVGATIALPFLDAMVPALSPTRRRAPMRLGFVYVPNGMFLPNFHPAGDGRHDLRADAGAAADRAAARARRRRQRAEQHAGARQRPGRRRPYAQSRRLAERRAAEADRRRQHHQRENRRSVRGRQARRRHAAAVARADARIELPGRQLRSRLQLRVPELHVLADARTRRCRTKPIRASSSSACSATAARCGAAARRCRRTAASSTR